MNKSTMSKKTTIAMFAITAVSQTKEPWVIGAITAIAIFSIIAQALLDRDPGEKK